MNSNAVQQADVLPADWFDAAGYFARPDLWGRQVAARIALAEGILLLTAKHWEVIDHVRGKYFQLGALPVMRMVRRACGLDHHKAHKLFCSMQRACQSALLSRAQDAYAVELDVQVALVDDRHLRLGVSQDAELFQRLGQGMPLPGIARHRAHAHHQILLLANAAGAARHPSPMKLRHRNVHSSSASRNRNAWAVFCALASPKALPTP